MKQKQKNIVYVILSCAVVCIFFVFYNLSENTKQENEGYKGKTIKLEFERKAVIHCDENLTNLFFHDYTVLIMGHNECSPCNLIKNELSLPTNVHIHVFYLDILKGGKHKMIAEALRTSAFPTVYLIDSNYEIKSILRRTVNLEPMLSSSIIDSKHIIEEEIGGLDDVTIRRMLSSSLKATLAYNNEKYEDVYKFSRESLGYGSYFFNNWLLYTCYTQEHKTDSVNHYKLQALNHINGVDGKYILI